MEESRLDKRLRAIAWTAVVSTVLLLMAMGVFLLRPEAAVANRALEQTWELAPAEEWE